MNATHDKTTMFFCAEWGASKQQTWSGTTWGLQQALKKYFDVESIELLRTSKTDIYIERAKKLFKKGDMHIKQQIKQQAAINENAYGTTNATSKVWFQFEETPKIKNGEQHYIYIDLSVAWLDYCRNHSPEIFKFTHFDKISKNSMRKRSNSQYDFFLQSTGIFTMGRWMADFLINSLKLPPAKIHHVGGGINSYTQRTSQRNCNTFLFIGRDFYRKGGDLVLEAFNKLHTENQNLKLIIAGPTQNPAPGAAGVEYVGDVSNEKIGDLFAKSDVYCMPSRFEAYGLVFPEALSAGLPCIGRNAYEMPYFIRNKETGFLVESDEIDELAYAMKECLYSDYLKNNVLNNQKNITNEYSWEAVAHRIALIIYNDIHKS